MRRLDISESTTKCWLRSLRSSRALIADICLFLARRGGATGWRPSSMRKRVAIAGLEQRAYTADPVRFEALEGSATTRLPPFARGRSPRSAAFYKPPVALNNRSKAKIPLWEHFTKRRLERAMKSRNKSARLLHFWFPSKLLNILHFDAWEGSRQKSVNCGTHPPKSVQLRQCSVLPSANAITQIRNATTRVGSELNGWSPKFGP